MAAWFPELWEDFEKGQVYEVAISLSFAEKNSV
jgi:hypothetical protein